MVVGWHHMLALLLVITSTVSLAQSPTAAQAPASAAGELSLDEAGRIDPSALFAATLYDLKNQPVKFATYKGKPMIVNFWARWCPPCRVEIPELVAMQQRHSGVEIFGINLESDPAPVADFGRAYDINYPVLLTREAGIPLLRALGNAKAGLPFTLVLNRHGQVVASRTGVMTRKQLEEAVARALH